jgi:integrase
MGSAGRCGDPARAFGGLRIGEMAGLRRGRVDLERGTVQVIEIITEPRGHLHFGPPKTSAGRRMVGLPRFVVEALAERMAGPGTAEELVFAGPHGGPLRVTLFRRRFWRPAWMGCASMTCGTRRSRCGSPPAPIRRRSRPGLVMPR